MNDDDPLSPMIRSSFSSITKDIGVEVPSHAQRILRKLSEMRDNANLCDTELFCQEETFQVHRSVLAGGSAYFSNYFDRWVSDPGQRKVLLHSVEPSALAVLLDFLYSGVLNINTNNMFDIFAAADKLQIEEARYVCITKLHVHLNPDSCVDTLNFAMLFSLASLADAAFSVLCSEALVYNSDVRLTDASWDGLKSWLSKHRQVLNPYTAVYNLLQIQPLCSEKLREIFGGILDKETERLLNTPVLPTALSILSAARANVGTKGEVTQDLSTNSIRDGKSVRASHSAGRVGSVRTSEDVRADVMHQSTALSHSLISLESDTGPHAPSFSQRVLDNVDNQAPQPTLIPREKLPIVTDPRLGQAASNLEVTSSTEVCSSEHLPTSVPIQAPNVVATPRTELSPDPRGHSNTRLWTIACNHPGHPDAAVDERAHKKRRVYPVPKSKVSPATKPEWTTKIMLLGGCNSTMSTVRTIFRHIQPFSVVTGVTVVRDNLSLSVNPASIRDSEEWDECGNLAQLCYGSAATTAGTKAYVFGGKDANSQYLAEFQEFDMVDNTCRVLPNGPQPKENAVAVKIGGDVYIVGGRNNTVQHSQYIVDKYNITSKKWEAVSPCFKIGYLGAAAACNGLLYTFCGQRPHGKATDTVMCYEPHSDSWSPQPNAPTTMNSCQAATYHRKIFLLATEYKNLILYHFQPDQQLWTKINKCEPYVSEPQNFFIMNSAVVTHEGYLYVLLFMCEDVVRVIRVQKFNIATGEWEIVSTKPVPVQNSGVVLASYIGHI